MAASVVDPEAQATVKMRVMNPHWKDSSINRDAVIGTAEPFSTILTTLEGEIT